MVTAKKQTNKTVPWLSSSRDANPNIPIVFYSISANRGQLLYIYIFQGGGGAATTLTSQGRREQRGGRREEGRGWWTKSARARFSMTLGLHTCTLSCCLHRKKRDNKAATTPFTMRKYTPDTTILPKPQRNS